MACDFAAVAVLGLGPCPSPDWQQAQLQPLGQQHCCPGVAALLGAAQGRSLQDLCCCLPLFLILPSLAAQETPLEVYLQADAI